MLEARREAEPLTPVDRQPARGRTRHRELITVTV
jgi:hypothetical protein